MPHKCLRQPGSWFTPEKPHISTHQLILQVPEPAAHPQNPLGFSLGWAGWWVPGADTHLVSLPGYCGAVMSCLTSPAALVWHSFPSLSIWMKAAFGQEPPLAEINALSRAKRQVLDCRSRSLSLLEKNHNHTHSCRTQSDKNASQETEKATLSAAEIMPVSPFPVSTETCTVSHCRPFALVPLTLPKYSWGYQDRSCQGMHIACHLEFFSYRKTC